MAGIDENGLTIKRLPDILAELQEAIQAQYGNDTPLDENSFFGILNTIYGASDAEVWELLQALNDQFNPLTATGKWLDDVAAYSGLTRLQPTASRGELSLFGSEGAVVPVGTEFSDLNGYTYESTTEGVLDTGTSRIPVNVLPTLGVGIAGQPSTTYIMTINGTTITYSTVWDADREDITNYFINAFPETEDYYLDSYLDNNPDFVSIVGSPVDNFNYTRTFINVVNKDATTPVTVSVAVIQSPTPTHYSSSRAGMQVMSATSTFYATVDVTSKVLGAIDTSVNTLVNIETPVVGLNSVYNQKSMVAGRNLETDEEFKARLKRDGAIYGYASQPAIEANLRQVEGVSFADVQVNSMSVEDSEGRPPNSYECVVIGGLEEDIGTTIFERGAAGIEPYGNTSVTIFDYLGEPQVIKFSRAVETYVWVKVYYSLNLEEVFPEEGEELMAAATLTYGQSLSIGNDVIPKRFYGGIYASTDGLEDVTVLVATSTDPTIEPDLVDFTGDVIPIVQNGVANFASNRIEIIEET